MLLQPTRIFIFRPVHHYPYFVFQRRTCIQRDYNSIRRVQVNPINMSIQKPLVFQKFSSILRSPVKLLLFTFLPFRESCEMIFCLWWFRTRKIQLAHQHVLHFEIFTGIFWSSTCKIRFGAIPSEQYTERSSDSHGRSTCYVHPFRRVPFSSCYVSPLLPPHLPPSPFPLPHHCSAFASLLLIRPRTGRSTRRHDISHRDVTSGTTARAHFQRKCFFANTNMIFIKLDRWAFSSE